jgi:putative membrane protein
MAGFIGVLLGLVIVLLVSALVIYIVGRLGIGLTVDGFGSAVLAAIVIAVVTAIVNWLLGLFGIAINETTWIGAIVALIIAAIILMISDRFLRGMKVDGFGGAIIAAIAIGVVTWIVQWLLGLFL